MVEEYTMKLGGRELTGPCIETLVLPRGEEQIVFKAQAIPDFDDFDALCPEPKAPGRLTKKGWEPMLDDLGYKEMLGNYNERRIAFMVVRSLMISDIEWDTVEVDNPKTWTNYVSDLKAAGLSAIEIGRVTQLAMQANALDESKLEEAREVFLRGQQEAADASSGLAIAPENMPSGKPAAE
jgi:hypothetical protein